MLTFYKRLSPPKKISFSHSMRILTHEFLKSYHWDPSMYQNKDEIINDLYFYWLRHSAEKGYIWCNNLSDDVFSESFAKEMKVTLYVIYCKQMMKKTKNQSRKII